MTSKSRCLWCMAFLLAACMGCGYTQLWDTTPTVSNQQPADPLEAHKAQLDTPLLGLMEMFEHPDSSTADEQTLQQLINERQDASGRILVSMDLFGWSGLKEVKDTLRVLHARIKVVGELTPWIECWVYPQDLRRLISVYWIDRISLAVPGFPRAQRNEANYYDPPMVPPVY